MERVYKKKYAVTQIGSFGFDVIPGSPQFAACEDFLASE
jgi:hypothetical protein